ncbi:hypothetical protein M5D96_007030, partial [Drosophila gunungcola]
ALCGAVECAFRSCLCPLSCSKRHHHPLPTPTPIPIPFLHAPITSCTHNYSACAF